MTVRTIVSQWCIGTCPAGHGTGWLERAAETRRGREHVGRARVATLRAGERGYRRVTMASYVCLSTNRLL